jgi:hypothetical protein
MTLSARNAVDMMMRKNPKRPRLDEARAIANARNKAEADKFADAVAPVIREAQAAGAKSLRQIAASRIVARGQKEDGAPAGADDSLFHAASNDLWPEADA